MSPLIDIVERKKSRISIFFHVLKVSDQIKEFLAAAELAKESAMIMGVYARWTPNDRTRVRKGSLE